MGAHRKRVNDLCELNKLRENSMSVMRIKIVTTTMATVIKTVSNGDTVIRANIIHISSYFSSCECVFVGILLCRIRIPFRKKKTHTYSNDGDLFSKKTNCLSFFALSQSYNRLLTLLENVQKHSIVEKCNANQMETLCSLITRRLFLLLCLFFFKETHLNEEKNYSKFAVCTCVSFQIIHLVFDLYC